MQLITIALCNQKIKRIKKYGPMMSGLRSMEAILFYFIYLFLFLDAWCSEKSLGMTPMFKNMSTGFKTFIQAIYTFASVVLLYFRSLQPTHKELSYLMTCLCLHPSVMFQIDVLLSVFDVTKMSVY